MPKRVKANGKTFTFDDNVTDEQIGKAIDEYFGVKKKEISEPTSTQKTLASNTQAQEQSTSSDTEEPNQTSASDGLGGPPKMKIFTGFSKEEQQKMQSPQKPATNLPTKKQIQATAGKPVKEMITQYSDIAKQKQEEEQRKKASLDEYAKKQSIEDAKNKIFSVDQDKLNQAVNDEESKNEGFLGMLKQGATDVLNSVSVGMNKLGLIDEPANLKLPVPYEDYLKGIDKSLPQDQRLAMAKDLFIKDKAKQQIEDNAKNLLSSTDPYIQEALKTEAINNLKVNPKDKAIAVQIQAINHDLEDLSKNPTPENLKRIQGLQEQYKDLTNDYKNNRYALSPAEQAKLFSLNYSAYDKLTADLTSGIEKGIGGIFNLAGQGTNAALDLANKVGILPKGFTEENIKQLKEVNPFNKVGGTINEAAETLASEYPQASLSSIANSSNPVAELGRWSGQTINGIATFAAPFLFGEGEAQLGAKLYIAASAGGNKAYEVDKENKDFKLAAADAYAKGLDKFQFDGKEYDTNKEQGKDLYSELQKYSVAVGYGAVDYAMTGGRLLSLQGGAKAIESALGEKVAKEQFESGLKGAFEEAKGVAGSIASKAHHGGALFAKVEAAKMFLDDKILDKKVDNPIEKISSAYLDGAAMDLFAQGSPMLFGYIVGKVSPNQNVVEIKNNTKKILDYENVLKDANDADKEIINAQIKELNDKNYNLVMKAYDQTKNMTPKQIETLLDIEKQKINVKKDAEYIKSDQSELDPSDKKEVLKGLKSKFAELDNKKIDIFNSEFSALKVLDQKEQDRLVSQAKDELGDKANEDLINRRAIEIHRTEIAKQVKPLVEEEAPVVKEEAVPSEGINEGLNEGVNETPIIDKFKRLSELEGAEGNRKKTEFKEILESNPKVKYIHENFEDIIKQLKIEKRC